LQNVVNMAKFYCYKDTLMNKKYLIHMYVYVCVCVYLHTQDNLKRIC